MKNIIKDEIKKEIENICNKVLKQFAYKNDSKLSDDGGFANSENFCEWNDNTFVINLFSISQDDFLEKFELFEELGSKLQREVKTIAKNVDVFYADDCPIIFLNINKL